MDRSSLEEKVSNTEVATRPDWSQQLVLRQVDQGEKWSPEHSISVVIGQLKKTLVLFRRCDSCGVKHLGSQ